MEVVRGRGREERAVGWVTWETRRIWTSTGRGNPARHAHYTISAKVGRPMRGPRFFFFERLQPPCTKGMFDRLRLHYALELQLFSCGLSS